MRDLSPRKQAVNNATNSVKGESVSMTDKVATVAFNNLKANFNAFHFFGGDSQK